MTFFSRFVSCLILLSLLLVFLIPNIFAVAVINITQLTYGTDVRDYGNPSWSPDGLKIAYMSGSGYNYSIWAMDVNSSNPVQLTREMGVIDREPKWSPDGSKIVFQRGDSIYIMDSNGSNQKFLIAPARSPSISPDGKYIAFHAGGVPSVPVTPEEGIGIFVMNIDGTNVKRLAYDYPNGNLVLPSWSPDGKKIVFARNGIINIMDSDGSNMTSTGQSGYYARLSPDGKHIAFISERAGDVFRKTKLDHIYVMNTDGTNVTQLTFGDQRWDGLLDWSPDGTKIIFDSAVPTAPRTIGDIYIMTLDFNATPTPTPIVPGFTVVWAFASLSILVLLKRRRG